MHLQPQILDTILKSPHLKDYYSVIKKEVETEEKKRIRFYEEMTEQEKVEFINGEVVVHSPVRLEHNIYNGELLTIFKIYVKINNLGFVGFEKILIKLTRNDYEPDICFFKKEKENKFKKGQMFFPAPDLIVEILSTSTEKRDRGIKFIDYAEHGVGEYWIIDTDKKTVEQYLLDGDEYFLEMKSKTGIIKSKEIKNLNLPVKAIFDKTENHSFLQSIIETTYEKSQN